jgi:hypothetical protein
MEIEVWIELVITFNLSDISMIKKALHIMNSSISMGAFIVCKAFS